MEAIPLGTGAGVNLNNSTGVTNAVAASAKHHRAANPLYMGVSINGGTPIVGWLI